MVGEGVDLRQKAEVTINIVMMPSRSIAQNPHIPTERFT